MTDNRSSSLGRTVPLPQGVTNPNGSTTRRERTAGRPGGGRGQGNIVSRPQTTTGAATQTNPQIDDKLNVEKANIVNPFGLDRSALSLIKFPSTIEADATPYVLIKIFKSAVGTIESPDASDPATNIIAGIKKITDPVAEAVNNPTTAAGAAANVTADKVQQLLGGASNSLSKITGDAFNLGEIATRAKSVLTNYALRRNIEQLSYAIALTMPENLAVSYQNNYDQLSLTAALGGFGLAAQALASTDGKGENANPFIAEAAGKLAEKILGEDFRKLGLFAATGRTVNPQLELIYNSPALRQFTLDFRLIARNAQESNDILKILKILKLQSAPEISPSTSSRYFIPPSQFQLEFYNGVDHGMPNQFLFKTKKCVLEDISIDYTGGGSFTTFYTGAPVEIRLSLKFTETVIIDKTAVEEGF